MIIRKARAQVYAMIKVAMIARSTLYTSRGGDTIQVQETARMLRTQGIAVDIMLSGEGIDYPQYQLLHFFNITRPADILYHIRKTTTPFVVSTILTDYSEYDGRHRKGMARLLFSWMAGDTIEYVKSVARWIKGNDRIISKSYFWKGQRRSIREIIKKANLLLPNSTAEYRSLEKRYGCRGGHLVIPNGIDPALFSYDGTTEKDPRLVLCVARIEGLKNQMNLIRALNNTHFRLVIIGAPSQHQHGYYNACRKIAAKNVRFVGHISQEALVAYYQKAKVHVLPSWFESTGLSSLESAAMGCSIVITDKGFAREYFGNHAVYCEPSSVTSIYAAVHQAASLPTDEVLQEKIKASYTWYNAGLCTAEGYKRIIKDPWD